jgi:Ca2+-binding RTX toxin-like protein
MDSKRPSARRCALLLACLVTLLACSATPAFADPDSCERGPPPGYNLITGRSGAIEGTPGNDYIVGSSGPDVIAAGYGNDIVCAGDGNDVVYGGGKGDDLHGQNGLDKLFGQLLDDQLYGGPERDVLIGGHGTDEMDGGEGNDWLRGGTNVDHYIGGRNSEPADNDNDVASFADATPTGGHVPGWNGVVVNLTEREQEGVAPHAAKGGGEDTVEGIESVIGSPFDDKVIADTAEPNRSLYGGMGTDSCSGGCREPSTNLTAPFAYLDRTNPIAIEPVLPDPMLIVVGGSASETYALSNSGGTSFTVTASAGGSPETLNSDASCSRPTRGTVTCSFGSSAPLAGGQTWFGAAGNDTMTDRTAAPNGMTTDLDGGDDSDTITGSSGSETLVSGQSGSDVLHGGAEGDALLALGTGGDQLFGEEGNDQLATSTPCEGHVYRGGPDQDVAGFARTTGAGVNATLGNPAGDPGNLGGSWYGIAFTRAPEGNNSCPGGTFTRVDAGNEILEGTNQDDVLNGNQSDNTIWSRSGSDRVDAGAGNDIVEGNDGDDTVFAGAGADVVTGGDGADRLHGEQGEDDIEGQRNADTLWGEDGNDRLFGGTEADELFGGAANDLIEGGDGVDELFGQAGNDRLRARDGIADGNVNCGADADEAVEADPFDPVVNCER